MRRFIDVFFNVTSCMVIIIVLYTAIILCWGWVLGSHSAIPDLLTPSVDYLGSVGALLGGTGTIALAVISLKALYSWREQHYYQHRFNSIIKILDAYDKLTIVFDEYLSLSFASCNDLLSTLNTNCRLGKTLDNRVQKKKLVWNNFDFDSVFENLEILFSDEEIKTLKRGSELVIGLMNSEISRFSGKHEKEAISEFMKYYPKPSKRLEKELKNIKKSVREMVNK